MVGVFARVIAPVAGLAAAASSGGAAAPLAHVPVAFENGHAYISVTVDDRGPYRFLLDTGASGTVVSARVAKDLRLIGSGSYVGGGGGSGRITYLRSHLDQIAVGAAALYDVQVVVSPSSFAYFSTVEGVQCDGIIGYDLFAKYVAQIDPSHSTLSLWHPVDFAATRQDGAVVPFRVGSLNQPVVEGKIDGIATTLWIDSGFRSTALVFSPFAERHLSLDHTVRKTAITASWGIGGPVKSVLRRGSIGFGPFVFPRAILQLSAATSGFDASTEGGGLVGAGILQDLLFTIDYSHHVLYVRQLKPFRDSWDRFGLWINEDAGRFIVMDVSPSGPGRRAGVHIGDVIVAVDHRKSNSLRLSQLRDLMRDPQQGPTTFRVRRQRMFLNIVVAPKSLI